MRHMINESDVLPTVCLSWSLSSFGVPDGHLQTVTMPDAVLTFRHQEHPLCRTGVSLLSRERFFIYLINKYISLSDICLTVHH